VCPVGHALRPQAWPTGQHVCHMLRLKVCPGGGTPMLHVCMRWSSRGGCMWQCVSAYSKWAHGPWAMRVGRVTGCGSVWKRAAARGYIQRLLAWLQAGLLSLSVHASTLSPCVPRCLCILSLLLPACLRGSLLMPSCQNTSSPP